ncbi:MAG: helix-turn-helix domain-containing protein, partial [Oscillospiraceae bacterium]|nr:helix-turn-helix domain-containing protein [Oscillospiraceae bacterium]
MNALKTGTFIAELRKEKGLTQSELAKFLFVSDKAISRWETGKGFPNIEILPTIAEFFGVTISEILDGERSQKVSEQKNNIVENNLRAVCNEVGMSNQKRKKQIKRLRIALISIS